MKHFILLIFLFSTFTQLIGIANAAKRLALVIGNDNYSHLHASQQLRKARNDAQAVGDSLEAIGFTVISSFDTSRREFNFKINELANKIDPGDTVAFFYAGHGVRIDGTNYLLPSDVPQISGNQKSLLISESINSEQIIDQLRQRGAKVSLLILDSCRNNPFQDKNGRSIGGSRGLAIMEPPEGTFILYSAGANQIALDRLSDDDDNPNSVFTRTLLRYLNTSGLEISDLAKKVRREVRELALTSYGHKQIPAVYNEMLEDFYLVPNFEVNSKKFGSVNSAKESVTIQIAYWSTVKNSKLPSLFKDYLRVYPKGFFANQAKIKLAALKLDHINKNRKSEPGSMLANVANPITPRLVISSANSVNSARKISPLILTQKIQRQLNRLGCSAGVVDGKWGVKSLSALSRAKRMSNIKFASLSPSIGTLRILEQQKSSLCQPSEQNCGNGRESQNGKCVRTRTKSNGNLPTSATKNYSGIWTITRIASTPSYCGWKKLSSGLNISNRNVTGGGGWIGKISKSGSIRVTQSFTHNGQRGKNFYRGIFRGKQGKGKFQDIGGGCRGTFTLTKF